VSVAVGNSDAPGDADGDGVALGSAPIALTHAKPISANKIRVAVITHHRIDDLSRNGANAVEKIVDSLNNQRLSTGNTTGCRT
jgi:2-methylaconitate cis-trans-isomerase PrpF